MIFKNRQIRNLHSLFFKFLVNLLTSSGDIYNGFENQCALLIMHASSHVCDEFLRFTTGVTLADSWLQMVAEPLSLVALGVGVLS